MNPVRTPAAPAPVVGLTARPLVLRAWRPRALLLLLLAVAMDRLSIPLGGLNLRGELLVAGLVAAIAALRLAASPAWTRPHPGLPRGLVGGERAVLRAVLATTEREPQVHGDYRRAAGDLPCHERAAAGAGRSADGGGGVGGSGTGSDPAGARGRHPQRADRLDGGHFAGAVLSRRSVYRDSPRCRARYGSPISSAATPWRWPRSRSASAARPSSRGAAGSGSTGWRSGPVARA